MKSILFIDDEPLVLKSLSLLLAKERRIWKMQFVQSGEEAIVALEREPFDVVVSDMRMPGMDGAELLRYVSERYSNVIRILLSGQADHCMLSRAVEVTDHFLSKPCSAEKLRRTLHGVLDGAD